MAGHAASLVAQYKNQTYTDADTFSVANWNQKRSLQENIILISNVVCGMQFVRPTCAET